MLAHQKRTRAASFDERRRFQMIWGSAGPVPLPSSTDYDAKFCGGVLSRDRCRRSKASDLVFSCDLVFSDLVVSVLAPARRKFPPYVPVNPEARPEMNISGNASDKPFGDTFSSASVSESHARRIQQPVVPQLVGPQPGPMRSPQSTLLAKISYYIMRIARCASTGSLCR